MKYFTFFMFLSIFIFFIPVGVKAQSQATDSNSTIDKVREKVKAIRQNPRAFIGTITDKTQTSLQLNSEKDKIESVSISTSTTFVRVNKPATILKYSDIAIGDYIAALGLMENGSALAAKRILLLDSPPENTRKIIAGNIKSKSTKQITIIETDKKETTLTLPKKWKGPDVKDFKENDSVIIVYHIIDGKITLRTIEFINKAVSPTLSSGN